MQDGEHAKCSRFFIGFPSLGILILETIVALALLEDIPVTRVAACWHSCIRVKAAHWHT